LHHKRHNIDRLGIISSGLCAVHCAALPLLISFGLMGTLNTDMHHFLEWTVIFCSLTLGIWSIYNALTSHGRLWPQLLIAIGAFMIIGGFLIASNHAIMAIGGIMLLSGHWSNWRLLGTSKVTYHIDIREPLQIYLFQIYISVRVNIH